MLSPVPNPHSECDEMAQFCQGVSVFEDYVCPTANPSFYLLEQIRFFSYVFMVLLVVKNPPASTRDVRGMGSIPESGRSPGGGYGNLLQYSCLENPMDRTAWQATIQRVSKKSDRTKAI